MRRPDRLIVSLLGLDVLALAGALVVTASIAIALLDSRVFWLACIGSAVTIAAVAGRGLVARKLRPLSQRITN
jgi:hypothetical protein